MDKKMKKNSLMIIDDEPVNLDYFRAVLGKQGYHVLTFPRGEPALKSAAKSPPDLIVLDIRLPDIDGFEVCRRLKDNPVLKEIPVIFLSALHGTREKVKAFAAGGADYVTKPFPLQEILARIENHLKLRRQSLALERQNIDLEMRVHCSDKELLQAQLSTIHALAELMESRDVETRGHIDRTSSYCRLLASKMMKLPAYSAIIDKHFVRDIQHASPLHDIGKFGIPDSILLKPGKLSREEFETMKTHVLIGERTLAKALKQYPGNDFLRMGREIARFHHEHWDGSGYPDGLAGSKIPVSARIMALSDVYDALRSERPYKSGFSHENSREIIIEGSGNHFDPGVVEAFAAIENDFRAIHEECCHALKN
jgi:putative two-component system response regulator